jgi:hypothetical protein
VRHFYVDNLAGNLAGTVKVAQAATGDYPVGSVLQLVPTEFMVKREKGFNVKARAEFVKALAAAKPAETPSRTPQK